MKVSKIFVRAAALAVLVLLVATPALAQRGKWWQNERFVKELSLTPEQSTRLEGIFQNHLATLRQRMEALENAERGFDRLVETGDDTAVMGQADVVEAARAELNKTRTKMLLAMRRSLTADQWAKFTAMAQSDRNRNRGGGPRPQR